MRRKKKPFVWLAALMCASALAVGSLGGDPPPKATSITGITGGGVMQGQSNAQVGSTQGTTRNTGSAKPRLVMSNMGKPVYSNMGQVPMNFPGIGSRALVFDLSPGTGTPPGTLGGHPMTPFPLNDEDPPPGSDVTSVSSPCGWGELQFSVALNHRRIEGGGGYGWWGSWSHGYTGDVYYTNGATSLTITLPQPACAFYFYVEPNPFEEIFFTAVGNDGTSSGSFGAHGDHGATYVGIFGDGLESVTISTDDGLTDFAIGEFGIACACEPIYVACCDEATGVCVDSVEILDCIAQGGRYEVGVELCVDLDPPCGQQIGACCVGPAGEPPYDPYECIGDMANAVCLAMGEETFWNPNESCDAVPPYDCGAPTYCDGSGGCDEYISRVEVGDIDNSSACTGYGDYTDQTTLALIGLSYDITVTNATYYSTDITTVWVDWNGDKDWDDAGEMIFSYDPGGVIATGTITVPPTAIPGYTRMRVRIQYGGAADPCGSTTYGEVEDYTVLVSGEVPTGACCDPYTGTCTDDVLATDCLPPLQFSMDTLCADLTPPCGNPGACCDDDTGECTQEFEANCMGRFEAGAACDPDPFDPPCGEWVPVGMLYAPTEPDNPTFRAQVAAITGSPCDYYDARVGTPTLEQLMEYACVFTWVDYAYANPVAMGDVLAGYLETGGKVILGQWCAYSGQNNWLQGRIMDDYPLVVLSGVTSGSYAGDGITCIHVGVSNYSSDYWDDVGEVVAPALVDGHRTDGLPSVVYAPAMNHFYSGGNTGNTYSTGDWAILTANMCMCTPEPMYGACCDPSTGICTDNVELMDCLPPLQFGFDTLCANMYPPCGNPGACCDPYTGICNDEVLELDCPPGFRFEGGEQCAEMEPECGTPGCCCDEDAATVSVEFEANCNGRFLPGVVGGDCTVDAFDPPCGEWTCSGILYAPAQPDNPTWRAQVAALTGQPCDYWDASASTPTLEYLQDYCCVFTWGNYAYADPVGFGNVLAEFVDGGGKVMLGQWTYPTTQLNWLEGEIMTPAYCPITATGYGPDSYVDGSGYDCVFLNVHTLSGSYFDQCTVIAGAFENGLLAGGKLAAAWRADRRVYYTPGNTASDYTTGDTAQLIANMCMCVGGDVFGACCDPYTGICTDDVAAEDCPPPLQFHYNQACADLDPPCGNLGACCDDDTGECTQEYEINCDGRFVGGAACDPDPFVPPCGEYHACPHEIVMWDDFGDGWNGGVIDVYVDGELVLAGVTLASGTGPQSVFFEAGTGAVIQTIWTDGGWPYECSYYIYDQFGTELCSDGVGGAYPTGVTCTGNCEPPAGACCLGYDGCQVIPGDDCAAAGGTYLGDFTDCGDLADCDGDGMTDLCAIEAYGAPDCNSNDIPDNCDIANCGPSTEPCDENAWCQDCQGDGIPDGCQLTVPPLMGSRDCCTSPDAVITIEILTDSWGYETSWTLTEQGCGVVASGSGYDSSTFYSIDVDVCSTSCYDFTINDDYGDGIYDPGGFTISYEGSVVFDAMGGAFAGASMTIPNIGGGCGGGGSGLLISQLPNQSNGIFSDCDCDICGQPQVLAENFVLTEEATINMVRFWGGMYASDHTPANQWNIGFYQNASGYPGAEIVTYVQAADEMVQTGVVLFGVHEWDVSVTLDVPLTLPAGTYFVAAYADSVGDSDSWFWEAGNLDFMAGVMGQAYGFECPPAFPYYDSTTDMAFELYASVGPPANDCNENCVPDECDPDCNCDGTPDDCEDPPFIPTEPTIECPATLMLECGSPTDPEYTGEATGTDNCGNPAVITYSDDVTPGCGDTETIVRTWTATDECAGLSSQCVQTITVVDTTPPEATCPEDVTVVCGESTDPADTGTAIGTDVCGDVMITYSDDVTPTSCLADAVMHTITRTWTATDECGLTSECVQTVTVLKEARSLIIKQGACPAPLNRGSHGVTPMVLTGDVDFDVYQVIQDTVRLSRADCVGGDLAPSPGSPPGFKFKDINHPYVGPGPCSCNDDDSSDGIMDLQMKFRTDDLAEALLLDDLPGGSVVVLALTGQLDNGCEFIAYDCVILVPKGGGTDTASLLVESNWPDVFIQVEPLDVTLDGSGYTGFERVYYESSLVTLTAPMEAFGRPFSGWKINGVMYTDDPIAQIELTDTVTLRAVYRLNTDVNEHQTVPREQQGVLHAP